LKKMF